MKSLKTTISTLALVSMILVGTALYAEPAAADGPGERPLSGGP